MCRVGHNYSKRGSSHSINSLVVGIGTCERVDRERGSMAIQCELLMSQMLSGGTVGDPTHYSVEWLQWS